MTKASEVEAALDRLKWSLAVQIFEDNTRQLSRLIGSKYDPGQPRDDHGRWTDSGGEQLTGEGDVDFEDVLAAAQRLNLTASRIDMSGCIDLCYPLLERRQRLGSDRNRWDFQKCLNACLGIGR